MLKNLGQEGQILFVFVFSVVLFFVFICLLYKQINFTGNLISRILQVRIRNMKLPRQQWLVFNFYEIKLPLNWQ